MNQTIKPVPLCVAFAILVVVAVALALSPAKSRPGVTQEQFDLLH